MLYGMNYCEESSNRILANDNRTRRILQDVKHLLDKMKIVTVNSVSRKRSGGDDSSRAESLLYSRGCVLYFAICVKGYVMISLYTAILGKLVQFGGADIDEFRKRSRNFPCENHENNILSSSDWKCGEVYLWHTVASGYIVRGSNILVSDTSMR